MWVLQRVLDIVDLCIRETGTLKDIEPFFRQLRTSNVFDHALEYISIRYSR